MNYTFQFESGMVQQQICRVYGKDQKRLPNGRQSNVEKCRVLVDLVLLFIDLPAASLERCIRMTKQFQMLIVALQFIFWTAGIREIVAVFGSHVSVATTFQTLLHVGQEIAINWRLAFAEIFCLLLQIEPVVGVRPHIVNNEQQNYKIDKDLAG